MSDTKEVVVALVRRVTIKKILDLRHRVLRAGMPLESARFDGDEDPSTWHVAVFVSEAPCAPPVCCASFVRAWFTQQEAWQLRGMATDPAVQRSGFGAQLLDWAMPNIVAESGTRLFWCNARLPAIRFYEKQGWECVSPSFKIEGVGEHRQMQKIL